MEQGANSAAKRPLQAAREPLSLRFLLAFSASTVLTASVAIPMAFQAHLAREERDTLEDERPSLAVMGTTTIPTTSTVSSDGLFAVTGDGASFALDGSELAGTFDIRLDLPDVARIDWALDSAAVVTEVDAPWRFDDVATGPMPITSGDHVLTATVTFTDGRVEVRRAVFTVVTD